LFKSKTRDIVIPQAEHAKLSGILAYNWGNEEFDKPAFDFNSFVEGVKYHDIGYGEYDSSPLGELTLEQWANLTLKGTEIRFDNPVVDIVTKLHLKRLLGDDRVKKRKEILKNIEQSIADSLLRKNNSLEEFLWADKITNFCDWVSFNFCFEKDFEGGVEVFSRQNSSSKTELKFHTNPAGEIIVNPWPFSVESITGFITAYNEKGYPKILKPNLKKYHIKKKKIPINDL
jgi:hypothetical protein